MENVKMINKSEFETEIFEGFMDTLNLDDIDDLEYLKCNDILNDRITEFSTEYSDILISRSGNFSYIIMLNNFWDYIAIMNDILENEPINNIDLLYSQTFYNIINEYLNDNVNEILNEIDNRIDEIENKNL
jgi:hypothetical protein